MMIFIAWIGFILFQYQKSYKAPFIIYADLECIIEKIDGCKNNLENSTTKRKQIHSIRFTIFSFRSLENKHDVYRGKDCIKRFSEFLRENAMKIIDLKRKQWSY